MIRISELLFKVHEDLFKIILVSSVTIINGIIILMIGSPFLPSLVPRPVGVALMSHLHGTAESI